MDTNQTMQFFQLLEELIIAMTEQRKNNIPQIFEVLTEICRLFGLSKGVTYFYENVNNERLGRGEEIVAFDTGEKHQLVKSVRILTNVMAVVSCNAYRPEGAPPLTPFEDQKLEIVMRTVLNLAGLSRLQKTIEAMAFRDDKGYRNMRSFMREIGMTNEQRLLSSKVAVNYNLRHFSLVNQEIGRKAGDIAMRNHYTGLEQLIGSSGTVSRLGGDNFVAFFEKSRTDSVLNYLNETPVCYDINFNKRIMIACSVGVYPIPDDFILRDPGEIMDKIIAALMAARVGGKERIVFFNEKQLASKEKVMRVQQYFPDALRNEEFKVFYQPKIDIETGALAGAEALCRWFRNGKIVPPVEFIPILEETTEICKLDFYMLDHVCKDLRRWLDEGRKVVRISVNLSRKHMMDIDLLQTILDIIDRNGVPHQYIEVELTETTTDVEFRDLKRVVHGLQQSGIYTSVDDFGIGYSSLNLIREIPWNVLKVDRSFLPVDEEDSESVRSIMFKYVVAMAREMGLECIAEGVETQAQVDILRENHCGLAQGFFFDKPLPVELFEERLGNFIYSVPESAE
ncbi:MAG: GGDEF domain-containing protein [Oscillospiraceae bacterium]|nr:GGDEF domain-containing protein [Oscillospiraceae bacterium]